MADEFSEPLDANLKARVPAEQRRAVEEIVRERRKTGTRVSRGDILREALTEYIAQHQPPTEEPANV